MEELGKPEERELEGITLKVTGTDDFGRITYKSTNGKRYVDVDGVPNTCSLDGEPDTPIKPGKWRIR